MTPVALHEVPRHPPSPTTWGEAIDFYTGYRLPVTPVRPDSKCGRMKGWSAPGHSAARADFHFSSRSSARMPASLDTICSLSKS